MPKQSNGGSRYSMNNIPARGALVDPQTYGMLLWQSKLQEKLLEEQKEKRQREKEEEQRKTRQRQQQQQQHVKQEESESQRENGMEHEKNESVNRPMAEVEIPPPMFPNGPAPYTISPPTPLSPPQNLQNGPSNGQGMFPSISGSRVRTSISCDNLGGKPPVPASSSSLLGNIVSFHHMGGNGSPRRTPSGKLLTVLRGDPEIRYHQKDTRNFDQTIRYLMDRDKVQEYRRELDQQLEDQRKWRSRLGSGQIKEITRKAFIENGSDRGRYGHGHGQGFESKAHIEDQGRNGSELAPLIRKFNSLPKLNTLSSTDVTRPYVHSPRNEFFHPVEPNEVAESLSTQLREKEWLQRRQQDAEKQATERHFQTWDRFWGRPGAGAPMIPFPQKSNMGYSVSFANLYENPRTGHTFPTQSQGAGGGGMGFNRVNLFKALHMTHQQPMRPK